MMAAFVLVHGAWHGAWCWQRVIPHLQAKGHTVIAPDLPGLGEDKTDAAGVTLADNVACIGKALDQAGEKAILVGHSLGGASDAYLGDAAFIEEARAAVELLPSVGCAQVVALISGTG